MSFVTLGFQSAKKECYLRMVAVNKIELLAAEVTRMRSHVVAGQ